MICVYIHVNCLYQTVGFFLNVKRTVLIISLQQRRKYIHEQQQQQVLWQNLSFLPKKKDKRGLLQTKQKNEDWQIKEKKKYSLPSFTIIIIVHHFKED